MTGTSTISTDLEIWSDVLGPADAELPAAAARSLLGFRFGARSIAELDALAAKNRAGAMSDAERVLLDRYLRVGNFLNLVHARAHAALAAHAASAP